MSVSIVMAYHNRKALLINTLNTIANGTRPDEIIIVDDASNEDNWIEDLIGFRELNIIVHWIAPEAKDWHNPCIPFNMGFKLATSDIIIIQNPECLHVGDVVGHAIENVKDGSYNAYSCYSIDQDNLFKIYEIDLKKKDSDQEILNAIQPFKNSRPYNDCQNGWYCHSEFNPCALHFCSAITKKDLDKLGGFDKRYAGGIGYDDNDFIARIRARMTVEMTDSPLVVHQAHKPTDYVGNQKLFARNQTLYHTGKLK